MKPDNEAEALHHRELVGCTHSLKESCEHCYCPVCGTAIVRTSIGVLTYEKIAENNPVSVKAENLEVQK